MQRPKQILIVIIALCLSTSLSAQYVKDSIYNYNQLNQLLEMARSNKDQKQLAGIYLALANYESDYFGDYGKSFEYYKRALEYSKILGDRSGMEDINFAIAKRYRDSGLYSEAIELLQDLILKASLKNDTTKLIKLYYQTNKVYKAKGDGDNAIKNLNKAISLNITVKDSVMLINILFDKIEAFELNYELDSALIAAFKVLKIVTDTKNHELASKSLYHIGYINLLLADAPKAIKYFHKSEYLTYYQPYNEQRKKLYFQMSKAYELSNNYPYAHLYLKKYSALNDSILNKNRIESFANLAVKYGSKDKQSSIEILKIDNQYAEERNRAQRKILYFLAVGLGLVLIAGYYVIKWYDQRINATRIINEQREEINEQKIRELEDNIKMSSMRSVIEGQENERERIAKDLHDSLGGLLSTLKLQFDQVSAKNTLLLEQKEFHKTHSLLDIAVNEVRNISRNLQPSSLQDLGLVPAIKDLINRFEGEGYPEIDFQHYNLPPKLDKMIALSVYRVIQELLNNTLKHAHAKEILLQIDTEDDELVIQYEDDGVGFNPKNLSKRGMGVDNIKSRINYLHGSIFFDSKEGFGTSVLIRVKYI